MSITIREINHGDRALQRAFCDYVPQVFSKADFRIWRRWGGWNSDYRAFAVFENGQVVANASVMRMRLLLEGRPQVGYQFGAVGCVPSRRGQGLAKAAMQAALTACGSAPLLLFGNPQVLDFYPRFGFAARAQHIFEVEHAQAPGAVRAQSPEPQDAAVRAALGQLLSEGVAVSNRFAARGYSAVLDWHFANRLTRTLWRLADDFYVIAGIEGDTLCIDDIFARQLTDLKPWIGQLIDRPIRHIRFAFTPERWWPAARAVSVDSEAFLFVRGFPAGWPGTQQHRFPLLAHT